ncbi:ABC transporter permease [Micromonospora sp. PLK6-60]|uniref:ABC transporter permease n=1 Tax=Micromonospora sp. PLK6-60 TaxID=2873383 RepID=UPI001CA622BD|nr:ABC transporter permease [Micromonospora sp. PLK6-60]MBY8872487.1 ABC transporter permease [Micromonospora sp. PLK6-60]
MSRTTMTGPATRDRATRPTWQILALLRMELLVLRHNWTATAMSVVTPLLVAILLTSGYGGQPVPGVRRVATVSAVLLTFVVHHHLTTVYAARRQEMVLKRLRTGLPGDRTILLGTASGTVLTFLGQALVLVLYAVVVLDLPAPVNPVIMLVALLLGAAVMAAYSAALSAVTRSSEAAMLTTLPSMVVFLAAPGALLPLDTLPPALDRILWFLPMGPFTELLRVGWLGRDDQGAGLSLGASVWAALPSVGVLVAWLVLGLLAARRWFRWEPRNG